MLRFTIRDLLWLTVAVALAVGWWMDRSEQARKWRACFLEVFKQAARDSDAPIRVTTPDGETFNYLPEGLTWPEGLDVMGNRPASMEDKLASEKRLRRGSTDAIDVFIGWPVDGEDIQNRRRKYEEWQSRQVEEAPHTPHGRSK